jgi:dTDP-4-amino-4,6-dideoxygalactose transaminase
MRTEAKPALRVPLLDLGRQYDSIREEVLEAIERVLASRQFILGEEAAAFEREVAAYTGAAEAVGCASGTDALWLAMLASGITPGDEVLTTPFSFYATVTSIIRAGARPVLCDIDPVTFNLDPALLEAKLRTSRSRRLRMLMPVHLYGQCADMDALRRISAEFQLLILEDAAQAFGADWRGVRAGAQGSVAAFSFYPTKNLSAAGDAGLVTTSDHAVADELRVLRNQGCRTRYHHENLGWNSRLDGIQAAILRVKMRHIDGWNRQRRAHAAEYDRLFRAAGLAGDRLTPSTPIVLPAAAPEASHIYHQYVIRADRREELRAFCAARGIGVEVYYPIPLHLQPPLLYLGYAAGSFPEAERAAAEVLALPIFPELTADEQRYVVDSLAEFYS